ncbi:hypothetical protein GCM10010324_23470 [Streptomyces hiroshimensis]|uniref:Uncharacterized protein n=1 Tax=Streptomyces hiroshimensis TaxID=66424 RepID=A0ABQ2YAU7_9ACTN|nr:hypothetical protein GCM10010324_23470 [Streptomyces hiroshimensis]
MPDDHDEVLGVQLAGGGDDVADEGTSADGVQDLGGRRLHAGALTRCENDDGCRAVGAHGCALRLRVVDIRRIPVRFTAETRAGPDLGGQDPMHSNFELPRQDSNLE